MIDTKTYDKAHLIVYTNDVEPFATNAQDYCKSALSVGFDSATHYTEDMLRKTGFWADNAEILGQERGAGYWLWKPYIILEKLRSVGPDDVVIYNDVGRYNPGSIDFFPKFPHAAINLAARSRNRFIHGSINNWLIQGHFTKRDCMILMDADNDIMLRAPQITVCPLIFLPSPASFTFLERWLEAAKDPRALTDQPDELGETHAAFIEHRHDQAIASILGHQLKSHYIDLSSDGGGRFVRSVASDFPEVPRLQTQIGYLSLVIERAFPDGIPAVLNDAEGVAGILGNADVDQPVPARDISKFPARFLRKKFLRDIGSDRLRVERRHIEVWLLSDPVIGGMLHSIKKRDDVAYFWKTVEEHVKQYMQGRDENLVDDSIREILASAFYAAITAYPKLQCEMVRKLAWRNMNGEVRQLFKEHVQRVAPKQGQAQLERFVSESLLDELLAYRQEGNSITHAGLHEHINSSMQRWIEKSAVIGKTGQDTKESAAK